MDCMCGHTRGPVIYSKFYRNPFRGFGTPVGQNLAFPLTLASRFYNSLYYRTSRDIIAYNAYAIAMDNYDYCLVVYVCRGTARRPRYNNSITTRWKFCSRFINTGLNAHYMPSYHLDRKSYMSFRLVPKSSAEGPSDATGILYNCEVEIL